MQTLVWGTPATNVENLKNMAGKQYKKFQNNNDFLKEITKICIGENSDVFILIFFYANVTFVKL